MLFLLIGMSALLLRADAAKPAQGIEQIRKRGYLLWGYDAEGGAPYMFPEPKDPSRLIGFEVDLAEEIAAIHGHTV